MDIPTSATTSLERIERVCAERAQSNIYSVSPETYAYVKAHALDEHSDPIAIALLVLSAGPSFEFSYCSHLMARAFRNIPHYPSHLRPLLRSWCAYVHALAMMRHHAAILEHRDFVRSKYVFCIDGNEDRGLAQQGALLEEAARNALLTIDDNALPGNSSLPSAARQLRLAMENLAGNYAPAAGQLAELQNCGLNELHGICAAAVRCAEDIDFVRALCVHINRRLDARYVATAYANVGAGAPALRQYKSTITHAGGTITATSTVIRAGALVSRDDVRTCPEVIFCSFSDLVILDMRGHLACGDHFFMASSAHFEHEFDKICAELEGIWLQMATIWYAPLFQSSKWTIAIHGKTSTRFEIEADSIVIPDAVTSLANYAHWMLDVLPRVLDGVSQRGADAKLVFLRGLSGLQMDSLAALGVAASRIFVLPVQSYPVILSRAHISLPYFTACHGSDYLVSHPALTLRLRAMMVQNERPKGDFGSRMYISRPNRKPTNESDYLPLLAGHGIQTIDHSNMSFAAQRSLFRNTGLLISPGGAGLANMIFMPQGSTVIAIYEEHFNCAMFTYLAAVLGIRYITVVGKLAGGLDRRAGEQSFSVDERDLELALRMGHQARE